MSALKKIITGFVFVAATVSCVQALETDIVKIGAIGAKTGDAATHGYSTFFPILRYWADVINTDGGLLGRKVQVLEYDNQSTVLGSRAAAKKAIADGVVCVIGPLWSSHAMGMAPVCQEAKVPMITPSATNPDVTHIGDYIFRTCFTDAFQGVVMANFARRDLHAQTAAVMHQAGDTYSIGLSEAFTAQFKSQNGRVLLESPYLKGDTDYSDAVAKLKQLRPDVVFIAGYAREAAFMIRQSRKKGIEATFLGGDGWGVQLHVYGGEAVVGGYKSDHWHAASRNSLSRALILDHGKTAYQQMAPVDAAAALTYDAASVFVNAVRRAGTFAPEKVRDALAETRNFKGATGVITIDENRNAAKSAAILKVEKDVFKFYKTIDP